MNDLLSKIREVNEKRRLADRQQYDRDARFERWCFRILFWGVVALLIFCFAEQVLK